MLPYFGTAAYYKFLNRNPGTLIERHENFVKSTARNRTRICGANGEQLLTIPIKGGKGKRQLYKEVTTHEDTRWQRIHWQSLTSSYRRSPYFEYFEDDFYPIFHDPAGLLFDFNWRCHQLICSLLGIEIKSTFTDTYKELTEEQDLRSEEIFYSDGIPSYLQVFSERNGFIENTSVMDLLFNCGPQKARDILNS